MNRRISFPTLKNAYDAYKDLANIQDTTKLAKLLLFHLFILKHLFNPIKFINKYENISETNKQYYMDEYREIIARAFCFRPLSIENKEDMQNAIKSVLKNYKNTIIRFDYYDIIEIFNRNFNLFWNDDNIEEDVEYFFVNPVSWITKKIPNINKKYHQKELLIDFNLDLNDIVNTIKEYAYKNKIQISNFKPYSDKRILSCKSNKIFEICFIFIKYYLQEKLQYETIYEELNIPYYKNLGSKHPDTKIRKNSIPYLNDIISDASIYKLKMFIKSK